MWRDSRRKDDNDGKAYVGEAGGTMAHLKVMEELD